MTRSDRIAAALNRAFQPIELSIVDESGRHVGHSGSVPGGETHYTVLMVSEQFRGQNRVSRSRAVHAALADEFASGLHALTLTLRTPEETLRVA
jgi:BolA protein